MPLDGVTDQSGDRDNSVERQAAMRFHEEVARERAGQVIKITLMPGDSIRDIGRDLYRTNKGRLPSDQELKAFEDDTANRNGLVTRYQRDHLPVGSQLTVSVPAREVRAATPRPKPAPEAQRQAAPAIQTQPAEVNRTVTREMRQTRRDPGAPACSGSWENVNMVARWVTHNEAGPQAYTAFNPNDMGHGISVGLMQWNQKRGKLPDLLQAWHQKNPTKFNGMFGRYADDLLDTSFVKRADFTSGTLRSGIDRALADPEFQRVQLSMRNNHIENSCEIARDYRFTSLRGRAIVADLVNQLGEGGTRRVLAQVPKPEKIPSESVRIERLKDITEGRVNGGDRVFAIEDRVKEIWRAEAAAKKM